MSLLLWLSAVPVILVIIRKYREYSWGKFSDTVCLQNKVVIVTGANSGIGKATVQELLKRKARVVMACRDINKTKEIIQKIRATISTGELVWPSKDFFFSNLAIINCF
jgi:FlaA1/EpsC-like NDP-sugar epimerase